MVDVEFLQHVGIAVTSYALSYLMFKKRDRIIAQRMIHEHQKILVDTYTDLRNKKQRIQELEALVLTNTISKIFTCTFKDKKGE